MVEILDCTLRDGANVVGKGFSAQLTQMIIEGLLKNNIRIIEFGNALGLGAYEEDQSIAPLNDNEYMELAKPYLEQAEIGMFIGCKNVTQARADAAKEAGLKFLRIGANAGDGKKAVDGIQIVKNAGLKCRYAIMKGYLLSPDELLKETLLLQQAGVDEVTIMDSAGMMLPDEVRRYAQKLSQGLDIPIGFHGHNNLGLSVANALAALEGGAKVLDTGLLGMARSAGNCATELLVAVLRRMNMRCDIDFHGLLKFLDDVLIPEMTGQYGYHVAVSPNELVYGYAGCHSSFSGRFEAIASEMGIDLYRLIIEVSQIDRKLPSESLIREIANIIKGGEGR